MNEKEKREYYIAMCKCCLLAQEMKTCPLCIFNIGLSEQAEPIASAPLQMYMTTSTFAMAEPY